MKPILNQLYFGSQVTVEEILRLDFSEFPPKGVDPAVVPKQYIKLLPSWRISLPIFEHILSNAFVMYPRNEDGRAIYFNPPVPRNRSNTGHETTHIMQIDHEIQADTSPEIYADTVMEDFWNETVIATAPKRQKKNVGYYESGREIQARLHQCLSGGYRKWGRLPGNKQELWAALISSGVKPPSEIYEFLRATETGRAALESFSKITNLSSFFVEQRYFGMVGSAAAAITVSISTMLGNNPITTAAMFVTPALSGYAVIATAQLGIFASHGFYGLQPAWSISDIQRNFSPQSRMTFWESVLPNMYGDLLEMYGDRLGRERMGFGQNEKLTGSWLDLLREDDNSYSREDFQHWASAIGPLRAAQSVEKIIHSRAKNDLKPNDLLILDAVTELPDFFSTLQSYRDSNSMSLSQLARTSGQKEIALKLG